MNRTHIIKALEIRGFSGKIQLDFYNNDGWYCNCDQMNFEPIGHNAGAAVQQIKDGAYDWLLEAKTTEEDLTKRMYNE